MSNSPSDYEGRQEQVRDWELPAIETFRNIYADRDYRVTMSIPEFTCVCPKTRLPDFATLTLEYVPDQLCLELKSLKEYLLAYRQRGIFHENVINRVLDDVVKTVQPRSARLTGVFNARGGIQTTVVREYPPGSEYS
jgi:7-cyano-7-deazaguanine reductase